MEIKNVSFAKTKFTKDLLFGIANSAIHHSILDALKDGFKSWTSP